MEDSPVQFDRAYGEAKIVTAVQRLRLHVSRAMHQEWDIMTKSYLFAVS